MTEKELLSLLRASDHKPLWELAHSMTQQSASKKFDFCAIINARSGCCSEDCKWCAQSAHHATGCDVFGFVGSDACLKAAQDAEKNRVRRIGIVTSGRGQSEKQIDELCAAIREICAKSNIAVCASLGIVSLEGLKRLKEAGLKRLHCNIETAPSKFPTLCTTHTTAEKIATIKAARSIGLEVCSGGIIGMGESDEELVEFAFALKEIAPDSIPVNILDPIPGTPLGSLPFLDMPKILDAIAVLRIVNPKTALRFAGGRRKLSDADAAKCIYVGINAGIQGPLLTTPGSDYGDDRQLAIEAGYEV